MAQTISTTSMEVPQSVQAAISAKAPEIEPQQEGGFRKLKVKTQLLISYGGLMTMAFGVLLALCYYLTITTEQSVITTARTELTNQIQNNSKLIMQETAAVLDMRLRDGFEVLIQPITFALFETLGDDSKLAALSPTYYDVSAAALKQPTTTDARYKCKSTPDDAQRGCNSVTGLQSISTGASSIYVTGSTDDGDGVPVGGTPAESATAIAQTSILDDFVKQAWADRTAWVGVFVAGMASTPILRMYPGAVGDLTTVSTSDSTRTYNVMNRPWYQSVYYANGASGTVGSIAQATVEQFLPSREMTITEPYIDLFGRGYILTVMAPIAGPDGQTVGVAGAEILVSSLQELITSIRSRETGEAHFFYTGVQSSNGAFDESYAGNVVASRQLDTSASIQSIPTLNSVTLPGEPDVGGETFGDLQDSSGASYSLWDDPSFKSQMLAEGSGSMNRFDGNGVEYLIVFQRLWEDKFCLVTVTSMAEVQAPIESQLVEISAAAAEIRMLSVAICAVCFVLIVFCTIRMSFRMAAPIAETVTQSNRIVRNIGGDLFEGVKIEGRHEGVAASWSTGESPLAGILTNQPGEVAALRGEFLKVLFQLNKKRLREPSPKSPLVGVGLPPNVPDMSLVDSAPTQYPKIISAFGKEKGVITRARDEAELAPPVAQKLNMWNKIVSKIFFYLLLPTMGAMIAVMAVTAFMLWADIRGWMEPVRQTMLQEELANLDIRAYERAQFTASFMEAAAGSLVTLHDFTTQLINNELPHTTPRDTWYSPVRSCGSTTARICDGAASTCYDGSAGSAGGLPAGTQSSCVTEACGYKGLENLEWSYTGSPDYFVCEEPDQPSGNRPGYDGYGVGYDASVVYMPKTALPDNVKTLGPCTDGSSIGGNPTNNCERNSDHGTGAAIQDTTAGSALENVDQSGFTVFTAEQLLLSQMDTAMKAVYFSSTINWAYMGTQRTEVLKQYPWTSCTSLVYDAPRLNCDVFPTQSIEGYTPLCRPWYHNTIESDAVTYNRVLEDATNPGEMSMSVTRRLMVGGGEYASGDADAELFGVLAVDVGLVDLSNQLRATPLYESGYAFIWDGEGYGVSHPDYALPVNAGEGALPIENVDCTMSASSAVEACRAAFQTNILNRGRVAFNWTTTRVPPTGEEQWQFSVSPVDGTPYMIGIAVKVSEITRVADEAMERTIARVTRLMQGAIVASFVIFGFMLLFTWWFNHNFAKPVVRLLAMVTRWGNRDFAGNIDAQERRLASSWELGVLLTNFKKMLVALRFGKDDWAKGRSDQVMQNNLKALEIVQQSGNTRGLGVVMNNMAMMSGGDPEIMALYPQLAPGEMFVAAITQCKEMCAQNPADDKLKDTLALRLLNCTLWHLRSEPPRPMEAATVLAEVVQTTRNARTMATVAQHVSADKLVSGGTVKSPDGTIMVVAPDPAILGAVSTLIYGALAIAVQSPIEFDDSDFIADLAAAHCDVGCTAPAGMSVGQFCQPQALAMWALTRVPTMSKTTMLRLCLHAKAGADPQFTAWIDSVLKDDKQAHGAVGLGEATAKYREMRGVGGGLPKAMMFVLDLSYSMDSDNRLPTCKKSLLNILKDNVGARDRAGLITFADDVKVEFNMMVAGEAGGKNAEFMANKVRGMRTRGMTAFYSAVFAGAKEIASQLRAEPATPKWLVALTDGADNKSMSGDAQSACQLLSSTPNLNLALITVGSGIDMKVCNSFIAATESAGNIAMLVQATNQESIAKAFETVSAAMASGVAEVL